MMNSDFSLILVLLHRSNEIKKNLTICRFFSVAVIYLSDPECMTGIKLDPNKFEG